MVCLRVCPEPGPNDTPDRSERYEPERRHRMPGLWITAVRRSPTMVSWAIRGMPPDRPGPGPRPIPMRCGGRARTGGRPPSRCRAVRSPPVMPDRRPGFVRPARRRAGDYRSAATMPAPGHPETPIACPTAPTLIRAPWIRRRSARRASLRGTTHPVADPTPPGRAEPRPTPRHQHTPRPPACRHPACRHPVRRPRERIRRVGRPMGRR